MVKEALARLGHSVLLFIEQVGQIAALTAQTFLHLPDLRWRGFFQQMAHLGVDSLPIVLLTILFTGMVITVQTAHEFVKYGAQSTVGGIVAIAMGRELSPVLTGVVVAGRCGAAITAELGSMKVTEQIDALRVMAVNPVAYLVVPRLLACMFMTPLLVVFADVIGTIGSYMVATNYADISAYTFMHSITSFAVANDVTGGLIKAMVFGGIVAIVGCHKGLNAEEGAEGVGKATTSSVVLSIIVIFIANYFMSLVLYR